MRPILDLPELPVWRGVSDRKGSLDLRPFSLSIDARGLVRQTTPKEISSATVAAYADQVYRHITAPPGASTWGNFLGGQQLSFVRENALRLGTVTRILDIGSGSIYVAEKLSEMFPDARFTLCDPTLSVSVSSKLRLLRDFFPSIGLAGCAFDLILSFNCLEHVPDPETFLHAVRTHLSATGLAILSFPDTATQLRACDPGVLVHEHFTYFTPASARRLFRSCRLETIVCTSQDSAVWIVARPLGESVPSEEPADRPLADLQGKFHRTIVTARTSVQSEIAMGRRVAFHGANNCLNNFLFLSGLGTQINYDVFDGDVEKERHYLPASSVGIKRTEDATYDAVDTVFVSAMTYWSTIFEYLTQHRQFAPESIKPLFPES